MKTFILLFISVSNVFLIDHFFKDLFTNKIISTNFIDIDLWSFNHLIFTIILSVYCKNIYTYLFYVFGWEIFENIVLPSIHHSFSFCKESNSNVFSDLLAALPGFLYLLN